MFLQEGGQRLLSIWLSNEKEFRERDAVDMVLLT